jgi:hypothetical protein
MDIFKWLSGLLSRRGRALWRYRCGIAKANQHDYRGAIREYTAAIEQPDCPIDVKGMATYNRALAYAAVDQNEKAADDLAAMLKMPELPENIKTQAYQRRERLRRRSDGGDGK